MKKEMNKNYETKSLDLRIGTFNYIAFKNKPNKDELIALKKYFELGTDIGIEEFKSGFDRNFGLHENVKKFMTEKQLCFSCTIMFNIAYDGTSLIDNLDLLINKKTS